MYIKQESQFLYPRWQYFDKNHLHFRLLVLEKSNKKFFLKAMVYL